jgi:hypothetical protein
MKTPKKRAVEAPAIGERLLTLQEASEVLRLNPRTLRHILSVAKSKQELSVDDGDSGAPLESADCVVEQYGSYVGLGEYMLSSPAGIRWGKVYIFSPGRCCLRVARRSRQLIIPLPVACARCHSH